jgi:RimJ/RimL family protein N-acetyltransferase
LKKTRNRISEHLIYVKNTGIIKCVNEDNEEENFVENWGNYPYPLACRVLKETDAPILYPVMKRNAKHLSSYIGWAKYAPSWNMDTVQKFVLDHVNSDFPRFHLVFTIGYEVVGFGSLAPVDRERSVQVALWVDKNHERRGIGSWIVTVLEWYAFHVFGFDTVYYQHDATNRKSGAVARRLGYKYSHSFDEEKRAKGESGFWFSHKKPKPEGCHPGYIDTGTISNWDGITFPWKSLI